MPGFLDDTDICTCGHIKDEHDPLIGVCEGGGGCGCDEFEYDETNPENPDAGDLEDDE